LEDGFTPCYVIAKVIRLIMKPSRFFALALLLVASIASFAQTEDNAAAIRREHWVLGALVSGGTGLNDNSDVQFIRAGMRGGRVMTGELGPGFLRGTFEWDVEVTPVDYGFWNKGKNVYGFGLNPVVLKWNFTRGRKLIPYFLAQAGVLWTAEDVPPGDTSSTNFTTGGGVGVNYFIKPGRSLNWDVRAIHISNASMGNHNPGVNESLQFSIGYNWWKK